MRMDTAKQIRSILNEIDEYERKLDDIKKCQSIDGTMNIGPNGIPIKYTRDSIEVKAIINIYEKHIEALNHKIQVIRWVES